MSGNCPSDKLQDYVEASKTVYYFILIGVAVYSVVPGNITPEFFKNFFDSGGTRKAFMERIQNVNTLKFILLVILMIVLMLRISHASNILSECVVDKTTAA